MIGDIGVCPKCKDEFLIEVKTNEVADIDLWPAMGVWWWVGLIALGSLGQVRQVTSVAVLLLLLPLLATAAICAWWYSQSKILRRRSTVYRLIGYMLFGLGSVSPISGVVSIVLPMVAKQGNISLATILLPLTSILFGAVLIVVAYFLVFQRS